MLRMEQRRLFLRPTLAQSRLEAAQRPLSNKGNDLFVRAKMRRRFPVNQRRCATRFSVGTKPVERQGSTLIEALRSAAASDLGNLR